MAWGKSCTFCYVMENITSGAWFEYRPVTNWDVVGDIVNPPLTQPMLSRFRSRRWRTWSQNGCVTIGRRRSLGTWQFILRRRFCRGPASSSPFWPPSQIQLGRRFACRRSSTRSRETPPSQMSCQCLFLPRRDDKALLFSSERGRAAAAAAALPWKRLPVAIHSPSTLPRRDCTAAHPPPTPASTSASRFPRLSSTRKERKKKLIKLVLLISEDPVWFCYRKSNTVTRAALPPSVLLNPHLKQQRGSHSEISVGGVRFRPICGINKRRLLGKCAPAPCLIFPPSHGSAELNNLTSGWCVSSDLFFHHFFFLPVMKWKVKWREWVSGKGCNW